LPQAFLESLEAYESIHKEFMWNHHVDAFDYMTYWRPISKESPEYDKLVSTYFKKLKAVRDSSNVTLNAMQQTFMRYFNGLGSVIDGGDDKGDNKKDTDKDEMPVLKNWAQHLDIDDIEQIQDELYNTRIMTEDVRKRIVDMYYGKPRSFGDALVSSTFLVVYGIKLLRLMFLYAGLDYAEKHFQTLYARQVYGQNRDPPHPFGFLVTALLVELGLNVLLGFVLFVLRLLFGTSASTRVMGKTFKLDDDIFSSLAMDYVATTLVLVLIMGVVSEIVRRKKYFRYRYEGERGIRALSSMTMSIAVFVYILPFYRII